ncbi:MAG TPA: PIN domain-containing protein [Polyangiaceae bacterium]
MQNNVVLVDTGPLVALFDPSDAAHTACTQELGRLERDRLVTTLAVLTEASYLLDFSQRAQQALLTFVARGALDLADFDARAVERSALLMSKYQDLPMDFADATLLVLAEALGSARVFTLDRHDFGVYRLGRRKLSLLPASR